MFSVVIEKETGQSVQGIKYKQKGKREKVKEDREQRTEQTSSFPPPVLHPTTPQRGITHEEKILSQDQVRKP